MELTVGQAAQQTGWSARMLRYLEDAGLVVPARRPNGYRVYGLRELNQLRSLRELRSTFGVELSDLSFAARLRGVRPAGPDPSPSPPRAAEPLRGRALGLLVRRAAAAGAGPPGRRPH